MIDKFYPLFLDFLKNFSYIWRGKKYAQIIAEPISVTGSSEAMPHCPTSQLENAMKIDNTYKYPCTRNIGVDGFGDFLEKEIAEPRRNIRLFAKELSEVIACNHIDPDTGLESGEEDIASNLTLVNSGSSANLVAALTLAERINQEQRPKIALVSAFTFPTTISALILAGFELHAVDVETDGFNMELRDVEDLAEKYNASLVVVTAFLGFTPNLGWLNIWDSPRRSYYVLLDACETFVCQDNIFTKADITTWSFYHPHHLSSYGGGAVYAKTKEDHVLVDSIAHWGRACKCHIDESICDVPSGPAHQFTYQHLGVNVEMSELNACFGRWQLREWENIEKQRIENYNTLFNLLNGKEGVKVWASPSGNSAFVFPIFTPNKTVSEVWEKTRKAGIEIRTLLGGPVTQQEAFKKYVHEKCPNAEYMYEHTFFVGCHHTLSHDDVTHVGEFIAGLELGNNFDTPISEGVAPKAVSLQFYGQFRTVADIIKVLNTKKKYDNSTVLRHDLEQVLDQYIDRGLISKSCLAEFIRCIESHFMEWQKNGRFDTDRLYEFIQGESETGLLTSLQDVYDYRAKAKLCHFIKFLNGICQYHSVKELINDLDTVLSGHHQEDEWGEDGWYYGGGGQGSEDRVWHMKEDILDALLVDDVWDRLTDADSGILDNDKIDKYFFTDHQNSVAEIGLQATLQKDYRDDYCGGIVVPKWPASGPFYDRIYSMGSQRYQLACGARDPHRGGRDNAFTHGLYEGSMLLPILKREIKKTAHMESPVYYIHGEYIFSLDLNRPFFRRIGYHRDPMTVDNMSRLALVELTREEKSILAIKLMKELKASHNDPSRDDEA